MYRSIKNLVVIISTVAAIVVAVIVVTYGLFLLFIGQGLSGYSEQYPGAVTAVHTFVKTPVGFIPLLGGFATLLGLMYRLTWLTWIGFVVIAVFSVLFIFGMGSLTLFPASMLLLLLTVKAIFERALRNTH